jgi:hypothetical protein
LEQSNLLSGFERLISFKKEKREYLVTMPKWFHLYPYRTQ